MLLGIDTGGTFTDLVLFDGHSLRVHKVLSTPAAPEQAILKGMSEMGLEIGQADQQLRLIHGSTVATNALLEHKGVRTAFITNKGMRDVLMIGRQARRELYNLTPKPQPPLVDRDLCLEVDTRLAADGTLLKALDDEELDRLLHQIKTLKPQAIAVSLLFSFLDNRQELAIKQALNAIASETGPAREEPQDRPDLFVSISSEILPEYKEYERGITTWLNSYVGPLVQGYLQRMEAKLPQANISIMQSSGSTCSVERAGQQAVNLLLSGPAGGLEGARFIGEKAGHQRLMTLDMGGTSTDVALIDGAITLTSEGKIGDYPVSVPMVDIHTIGAGGGSIAWVDEGGLLQVGPQSAGAVPGPACYGQGGLLTTVTDANLILGRLPASTKLGNDLLLDLKAARSAMQTLTDQLELNSIEETAGGVIRLANEHMAGALRVISVQKGYDPRDFVLSCFGGAGGLHVCELADSLQMNSAMVPVHAGVLSALGMLTARPGRQLSKTLAVPLAKQDVDYLDNEYQQIITQGIKALEDEGQASADLDISRSLDLCYNGQSFTLNIPWQQNLNLITAAFHQAHESRYGHRLDMDVELINLRVSVTGLASQLKLPSINSTRQADYKEKVRVYNIELDVEVWWRDDLISDQKIHGPVIIAEPISTTFVAPNWDCKVDEIGNLQLHRQEP